MAASQDSTPSAKKAARAKASPAKKKKKKPTTVAKPRATKPVSESTTAEVVLVEAAQGTAPATVAVETAAPPSLPEDIMQLLNPETVRLGDAVYQLWWNCADFELTIVTPVIKGFASPQVLMPEILPDGGAEFVYPIHDWGNRFQTSKQTEIFSAGKSMCKLYYTIEKIVVLLMQRLSSTTDSGGRVTPETEVQVSFAGHELAQRKAFEVIINLAYNVVVTNFEPGAWGERYLKMMQTLSKVKGIYPAEAPRSDIYRRTFGETTPKISK